MSEYTILQVFADKGTEADTLQNYGNVLRLSIDVDKNESSDVVQADATKLPLSKNAQFDIGWFHPPCGFVSIMSETGDGSRSDWPNLIPNARSIAEKHCDHYVIENKPSEHIDPEVVLDGKMFGLGIEYKRAFETNFPVKQPPRHGRLSPETETSPFYYTEKSKGWWVSQKGCSGSYPTSHIAKNAIPSAYINHIMGAYSEYKDAPDIDYSNYDAEKQTERSKATNQQLSNYE
jgi:hypothetical protein